MMIERIVGNTPKKRLMENNYLIVDSIDII